MARIREITASSQQEIIIVRATVISIQCGTELYQSNASENGSGGTVSYFIKWAKPTTATGL